MGILGMGAPEARAMDRDVRAVVVTSLYGAAAGTVLGLASYPITEEVRGIFMGTSIGLYLGIAVGLYFISNRDEPGNPLRSESTNGASVLVAGGGQDLLSQTTPIRLAALGPPVEGWTNVVHRQEVELWKARHTVAGSVRGPGFSLAYPLARF